MIVYACYACNECIYLPLTLNGYICAVNKILFYSILFYSHKLSFFLSLDTALPPREDYVQVDCVLKPRYKKCTEKEKIKMIGLKRIYKKN